jgi:anaphase-promoting complex subunit 4
VIVVLGSDRKHYRVLDMDFRQRQGRGEEEDGEAGEGSEEDDREGDEETDGEGDVEMVGA